MLDTHSLGASVDPEVKITYTRCSPRTHCGGCRGAALRSRQVSIQEQGLQGWLCQKDGPAG